MSFARDISESVLAKMRQLKSRILDSSVDLDEEALAGEIEARSDSVRSPRMNPLADLASVVSREKRKLAAAKRNRTHKRRQAAQAKKARAETAKRVSAARSRMQGEATRENTSRRRATRSSTAAPDDLAAAYAALKLEPGADFAAVRKSYRALMRKYHPDKHAGNPKKLAAANQLSRKVNDAYKTLEAALREE